MSHYDKPKHQRWLYRLSDMGLVKAILIIWGICWATILLVVVALKVIFGHLPK